MSITPLTADFGARVTGVDIAKPLEFGILSEIREAFDRYSVLIFPDQALDDESQIAFSERFGPCWMILSSGRRSRRIACGTNGAPAM